MSSMICQVLEAWTFQPHGKCLWSLTTARATAWEARARHCILQYLVRNLVCKTSDNPLYFENLTLALNFHYRIRATFRKKLYSVVGQFVVVVLTQWIVQSFKDLALSFLRTLLSLTDINSFRSLNIINSNNNS